jgi:hypothetical protein
VVAAVGVSEIAEGTTVASVRVRNEREQTEVLFRARDNMVVVADGKRDEILIPSFGKNAYNMYLNRAALLL